MSVRSERRDNNLKSAIRKLVRNGKEQTYSGRLTPSEILCLVKSGWQIVSMDCFRIGDITKGEKDLSGNYSDIEGGFWKFLQEKRKKGDSYPVWVILSFPIDKLEEI